MQPSTYNHSHLKRAIDLAISLTLLVTVLPLFLLIAIIILIQSGQPVFFFQKRVGKQGKIFLMYKFRTMYVGAENDQQKYQHLNHANGPVFKIKNDPRFIGIGKWLSNTGLDELPQLANVIKGEMSVVGPRPLPASEDSKIPKQIRKIRQSIKPGIICSWVVEGKHNLSFVQWMDLDLKYISSANMMSDIFFCWRTLNQQLRNIFK